MKDLTNLKTFIIDSDSPKEIDDAISLEKISDNSYCLWVHISYPCKLFSFDSEIDKEAKKKCSSIYLIDSYVPILPPDIIEKANLKENKKSETISAGIILNKDGFIENYEITEAVIKPNYEITFYDANELLELQLKEEFELNMLNKLLIKSKKNREHKGAINFEPNYSKIIHKNNMISFEKFELTNAHNLVSEAMILMGFVISDFMISNKIYAPFRSQKINCDAKEILQRNSDSLVKFSILKQYIGKSFISTKHNKHETLGLDYYVQSTSPLRRYIDLIVQRQISLKLNNKKCLEVSVIDEIIDYLKSRQMEINNIIRDDKNKYLKIYFNQNIHKFFKVIFIRWINQKKNIALVFFPDLYLETLVSLFISIDTYPNKIYKVKYHSNNTSNLLEFIH